MPPDPSPRNSSFPPPRPASSPPPASTRRAASSPPSSPRHEDLNGASGASVRFRPARLDAADIPADLTCRFRCDGILMGPFPVLDLSATGFAVGVSSQALAPGSVLESFELVLGDRPIWAGEAAVVHGTADRIGG